MRPNRQMTGRVDEKSEEMKPESKGMDLNIGPKRKFIQKLKVIQVAKDSLFLKNFHNTFYNRYLKYVS